MKRQLTNLVLALGCAAMMTNVALHAQENTAVARVPFGFHLKDYTVPAGAYTVEQNPVTKVFTIGVRGSGGHMINAPANHNPSKAAAPKLVFHRCGSDYFLAEIWTPDGMTYKLRPSNLEKEMVRSTEYVAMAIPLR